MVAIIRKKAKGHKEQLKHAWMIVAVLSLVAMSLLGGFIAYRYNPPRLTPCELVEGLCTKRHPTKLPSAPVAQREYTSQEVAAFAVARDILAPPRKPPFVPKVAFMFLTPGQMPLEFVWEWFFKGQDHRYTVYVHASEQATLKSVWKSKVFIGREIPSGKVFWGGIEMIDAEKRLLASALMDIDNHFFVLLSESCIPLHDFEYIYGSLINSTFSFVDNFDDPGPHGIGRYMPDKMQPEIQARDWRKGAQWFAVMRKHALLLVLDNLYYSKFSKFCKRGDDHGNCYPDEHYVQTYLHIMDPTGLSNWTITHVDWSGRGWHPKAYGPDDVTVETLKQIQKIDEHVHTSSNLKAIRQVVPCLWNGERRPCFLFARKFLPESAEILIKILPDFVSGNHSGQIAAPTIAPSLFT